MSLLSLLVFVTLWALGCLGAGTETRQGQLLATSSLYPATLNSLAPKSTAPATATPLPQLPTGHDACVFEDLEGLVDRAVEDWAGYNVSLLVETCPNVCEVAFGTGNPDISGPGAMVSYALQGIASIVFGPLLGLGFILASSQPDVDAFVALPEGMWSTEYFLPTATSIHQSNLIVALSVMGSSVKRLQSVIPLAEQAFITGLAGYQMFAAAIGAGSYAIIHKPTRCRSILVAIHMMAVGVIYIFIAASKHEYSFKRGQALRGITTICSAEHGWPSLEINVETSMGERIAKAQPKLYNQPYEHSDTPTSDFFITFGLLIVVAALLSVAFQVAPYGAKGFRNCYFLFCRAVNRKPKRVAGIIIVAVWTVFSVFLTIPSLLALYRQREQHRQASQGSYTDDEWGFGQVMAVMAWIPVLQEFVIALYGTAERRWQLHKEKSKDGYAKLEPESSNQDIETMTNREPPHSSSANAAPVPGTLSRRETWEREESGGYLPGPIGTRPR